MENEKSPGAAYEKAEIRDYGDLRELTEAFTNGNHTDVPIGTPVDPTNASVFSF